MISRRDQASQVWECTGTVRQRRCGSVRHVMPLGGSAIVVAVPPRSRSHTCQMSSPRHISPVEPSARGLFSTARGSVQRLAGEAGPQQRTDRMADSAVSSRGGTSRAPLWCCPTVRARRQLSPRRAEVVIASLRGGGHRLAARRQLSPRRAEAVIASLRGGVIASPRGGSHRLAARRR